MLARIISGLLTIVIGTSIYPEISSRLKNVEIVYVNHQPQKQTYADYVEEQLRVERMMR